ncbi:MAG TPA: hypothetical protein VJK53_02435, partial [Candidatus Paceibacterota bacterium]
MTTPVSQKMLRHVVLFLILIGIVLAAPGFALAGMIQGTKIDAQGDNFTGPSTISIRKPDSSWYGPSFQTENPFYFTDLSAGEYEVGMQVPDGYVAQYSTCTNCINHPESSWVNYQVPEPYTSQKAGYAPVLITVPQEGFVDLWWRFTKADFPQNKVFDQSTLNQKLTCNFDGFGIPRTTNSKSVNGSDVGVTVGIAGGFGGIGTQLILKNLKTGDAFNIVHEKSAAGAAWQTSLMAGDSSQNLLVIPNQAAGNSDLQWGYEGTYSGLQQLDWNPLYSDHYSNSNFQNNVGTTPCYGDAYRFSDGQSAIKMSSVSAGGDTVVRLINEYKARHRMAQNWSWWGVDQALYLYRDFSKAHNLRVYFAKADGSHIEGPIVAAEKDAYMSKTADVSFCSPIYGLEQCEIMSADLSYVLLMWDIGGSDIAIALHRDANKPFNANLVTVFNLFCSDPNNSACGNISLHNVLDSNFSKHEVDRTFSVGEISSYAFTYDVGTLDQLAALGYKTPATSTPTVTLDANGQSSLEIYAGDQYALNWSSSNVTGCTVTSSRTDGHEPKEDYFYVTPNASGSGTNGLIGTYTLTCVDDNNNSATVSVVITEIQATAVIQGYKVASDKSPTITGQPVTVVGVSTDSSNPYAATVNAGATYTVSVPEVAGYTVGYTLCIDSITCHSNTPTPGTSATVTIPAGSGHYADLWWHYTLVAPPPPPTSFTISASPNPCTIESGKDVCTSTISWTAPEGVVTQVWVDTPSSAPELFACKSLPQTLSQAAPWIDLTDATFSLYQTSLCDPSAISGLTPKASVTVKGTASTDSALTPPVPTATRTAIPTATLTANGANDVTINAGEYVTLNWSSTNAASASATVSSDSLDTCK